MEEIRNQQQARYRWDSDSEGKFRILHKRRENYYTLFKDRKTEGKDNGMSYSP